MAADIDGLDASDELTADDIPALDADECIRIRKLTDALRDMKAEMASYTAFVPDLDGPDPDETDGAPPSTVQLDTPTYLRARFEYMVTGWKLWKPPTDAQRAAGQAKGDEIRFTRENRDRIFRLFGAYLVPAMAKRAGGIAVAPAEGKKDADGNPLTFRQNGALRGKRAVAGSVDAGGVRAGATGADRQGAGV